MKLYTKFGDQGETALFDGSRVWKDDARVHAYGMVDALNSVVGWCRREADGTQLGPRMESIQRDLFVLGAQLATPPTSTAAASLGRVGPDRCGQLERWIDEATGRVEPLRHFILPGGCELAARLHMARTSCRNAERAVVALHRAEPLEPDTIVYLNRLGDLLFAWSRQANHEAKCPETLWMP